MSPVNHSSYHGLADAVGDASAWVHDSSASLVSSPSVGGGSVTTQHWKNPSISSGSQTSKSGSAAQSPPSFHQAPHASAASAAAAADTMATKPTKRSRAKLLDEREAALMEKDDSELTEEELVVKKKAQNRLAQRAFRERKETKLKELENKLLQSEEERQKLVDRLESIRLQYITVRTENSFLRHSSDGPGGVAAPSGSGGPSQAPSSPSVQPKFSFPKTQHEFISEMVGTHPVNPDTVNKVYEEPKNPGTKVLAVGAVWDYLQIKSENEGYENVDLFEVMQLLRGKEKCHGYGPAYPLDLVDSALNHIRDNS